MVEGGSGTPAHWKVKDSKSYLLRPIFENEPERLSSRSSTRLRGGQIFWLRKRKLHPERYQNLPTITAIGIEYWFVRNPTVQLNLAPTGLV